MVRKKGQITAFILLGIILMTTFVVLVYFISKGSSSKAGSEAIKAADEMFISDSIKTHISNCLSSKLDDGLILIGERGGYLRYSEDFFEAKSEVFDIRYTDNGTAYLIQRGDVVVPWYPCEYDGPMDAPIYCGYINDARLYDDLDKISFGEYKGVSEFFIRRQLEQYIEDWLPVCFNNSYLRQRYPQMTIVNQSPKVEVKFAASDVRADLDYQLDVSVSGSPPITKLSKFSAKVPVRFSKIYSAIIGLISKDQRDIDFRLYEDARAGVYKGSSLQFSTVGGLSITREYLEDGGDELYIINDSMSLVKGEPYVFRFARENRNPALDLVPAVDDSLVERFDERGVEYLLKAHHCSPDCPSSGEEEFSDDADMFIEANAGDPDEDVVKYRFSTSDPKFLNWSSEYESYDSLRDNVTIVVKEIEGGASDVGYHNITVNVSDAEYQDSQLVRIFVERLLRVFDKKKDNFYDDIPNKYASIEDPYWFGLNHSLMGDLGVRYDYRVYSTTPAKDISKQSNVYWPLGEREKYLYYFLPGLGSEVEYSVLWDSSFDSQPYLREYSIDNVKKNYLEKSESGSKVFNFPLSKVMFEMFTTGLVSQTKTVDLGIDVKKCFPHRNDTVYSYPYDDFLKPDREYVDGLTVNPYTADHTCCSDSYEYTGASDCFSMHYYSSRPDLGKQYFPVNLAVKGSGDLLEKYSNREIKTEIGGDDIGKVDEQTNLGYNDKESENDIYKRTYSQNCLNTRGNACAGQLFDIWVHEDKGKCDDFDLDLDGNDELEERCSGPARWPGHDNPEYKGTYDSSYQGFIPSSGADVKVLNFGSSVNEDPECYLYEPGESFEKNFAGSVGFMGLKDREGGAADGICNKDWKCTSTKVDGGDYGEGYNSDGSASGNFACQAQCDGSRGCSYSVNCVRADNEIGDRAEDGGDVIECAAVCDQDTDCPNKVTSGCGSALNSNQDVKVKIDTSGKSLYDKHYYTRDTYGTCSPDGDECVEDRWIDNGCDSRCSPECYSGDTQSTRCDTYPCPSWKHGNKYRSCQEDCTWGSWGSCIGDSGGNYKCPYDNRCDERQCSKTVLGQTIYYCKSLCDDGTIMCDCPQPSPSSP